MKYILFSNLIFICLISNLKSQNLIVLYKSITLPQEFYNSTLNELNITNKSEIEKIYKNVPEPTFHNLYINNKITYFHRVFDTSIATINLDIPNSSFIEKRLSNTKYLEYLDYSKNLSLIETEIYGASLLVKDKIKKYNWNLGSIHKKIMGYDCLNAVANIEDIMGNVNEIEVWYTPYIPISYGPSMLGGLPGLILQTISKGNITTCIKIDELKNEINIPIPTKGEIIDKAGYKDFLKTGIERFIGNMQR